MLTVALVSAVTVLALTTALLVVAGGRRTSYHARIAAFLPLFLAPFLPLEAVIVLGAIALVAMVLPRYWYAVGSWLFSSILVASLLYGVYLVQATLLLGDTPGSLALGCLLLVVQLAAMALLGASAFELVDALCAPPPDVDRPADPSRWPVVCLQVPTYNEPPDLVIETIRSLVAIEYAELRVQVIDNNTADADLWRPVEIECTRLRDQGHRVDFVHLPTWPGYKGGALNWGLAHLADDVEVIGVVDADYVVEPSWLRETVPHFADPLVAFVQTPQDYRAWQDSGFYRACYFGFAYFFKVGMVSRSRRNSIIFAGTMGLIRRSALEEVGGWDERIITEDAEISLRVLDRGYRSVYIPDSYGHGIMPLSYEGLRKQRFRWAFGGIQILRRHLRTILHPSSTLTLGQRYDHLVGGLWWFVDALALGFALFVGLAAVGAIAGRPFVVQRLTGLGVVMPLVFIGLTLVRYMWGLATATGARPALALAALRVNVSLSWVVALACLRALTQERGVFLRTPKFRGVATMRELRLVWVETALASVMALLLVLVVLMAGMSLAGSVLAGLLAWSVAIYASATEFALGDPARAPLSDVLRRKAALEIAPRVGRVARSRPARASAGIAAVAALALALTSSLEWSRPAVESLPFDDVPQGLIGPAPLSAATPTPPPIDVDATASPASTATPTPGATALAPPRTSPAESEQPAELATPVATAPPPGRGSRPTPPPASSSPVASTAPTTGPQPVPTPTLAAPTQRPTGEPPTPRPTVPAAPDPTSRPPGISPTAPPTPSMQPPTVAPTTAPSPPGGAHVPSSPPSQPPTPTPTGL